MFDYKHAVIYQIWPRSFKDSNGDGIGDLNGIREKLPYIRSLGVDAIWLSPVYASPNDDYGYDISDYAMINPEYGTMEEFDALIREADALGISLIMDLVANHTSTQHKWFQEALKDPSSKYRDYYIFREGTADTPPNNWLSFFGESAWQKAEGSTWYMTLYTKTQADLNWTNPEVRKEISRISRFWLEKGVAGFRMDTINTIDKISDLRSKNPEKKGLQFPDDYVIDRPAVRPWIEELRKSAFDPYDAFILGEGVMISRESVRNLCGSGKPFDMMFHFDISTLGYGELGKYDCRRLYLVTDRMFKAATRKWQNAQFEDGSYIGNYLSNHDHKRHLSRFGSDKQYRAVSAKMLAMYNFTLYGTPFIYQGEEIAMTNPKLTRNDWRDYEVFSSSKTMSQILHIPSVIADRISSFVDRDNARTPVQWSAEPYAGFSTAKPWILVNPDYTEWNTASQEEDPDSVLNFYRKLSALRHEHECLCTGSWREYLPSHPHVLAYARQGESETAFVLLNLSGRKQKIRLNEAVGIRGESVLSNLQIRPAAPVMTLAPYEAQLYIF